MSWELEGLIAHLVVEIACTGSQGCAVPDLVRLIRQRSLADQEAAPSFVKQEYDQGENGPSSVSRGDAAVWSWLAAREDISIGPERKFNNLPLADVLRISRQSPVQSSETREGSPFQPIRVHASEEAIWESIAGHGIDFRRLPRLEWVLLQGIASSKSEGILQGDLGRLVNQDKRSVPKRTDALVEKGYVTKRTTAVRGTKTSKLWLRSFAPPQPKEAQSTEHTNLEMVMSMETLVETLEPVPWHTRWTGESVDHTALVTTIMEITKAWGTLRIHDLKSKLGVLRMRWQMKVVSKTCRYLSKRGAIQYVAAMHEDKLYKDCIRYVRDLNAEDWSRWLSPAKRQPKSPMPTEQDGDMTDLEQDMLLADNVAHLSKLPPWSIDKPLYIAVADFIRSAGKDGMTHPDIYALTLGPSFDRYLPSLATAMTSIENPPAGLEHLQIRSEHIREGKIAYYRFFAQNADGDGPNELALRNGMAARKSDPSDAYGFSTIVGSRMPTPGTLTQLCGYRKTLKRPKGRPRKVVAEPVAQAEESSESNHPDEPNTAETGTDDKAEEPATAPVRGRPPGRGRGRGRGGRGRGRPLTGSSSDTHPWKCEKCGNSWKNELGLKYHLEKSRSSCNPSYVERPIAASRPRPRVRLDTSKPDSPTRDYHGRRSSRNVPVQIVEESESSDSGSEVEDNSVASDCTQDMADVRPSSVTVSSKGAIIASKSTACSQVPQIPASNHGQTKSKPVVPLSRTAQFDNEALAGANLTLPRHVRRLPALEPIGPEIVNSRVISNNLPLSPQPEPKAATREEGTALEASGPPPKKTSLAKARAERKHRITAIIDGMLSAKDGVIFGGDVLVDDIGAQWGSMFPVDEAPSAKDIQRVIRALLQEKRVVDHWHGFRDQMGRFTKCQLILMPEKDPFSPEVVNLLDQFKRHQHEFTSADSAQNSDPGRGRSRRTLPQEVAVLDAPIYAARTAAKRDGSDAEEEYGPRKRSRKEHREFGPDGLLSGQRLTESIEKLHSRHGPSASRRRSAPTIEFLAPNTHLEDESIDSEESMPGLQYPGREVSPSPPEPQIDPDYGRGSEIAFQAREFRPISCISGKDGKWPALEVTYFESLDASFAMRGWIPGQTWYAWSLFAMELDKRATARGTKGRFQKLNDKAARAKFVDRIRACQRLETTWATSFINASRGAAGPHNIFLNFFDNNTNDGAKSLGRLVWPEDGQLTLDLPVSSTEHLNDYSASESSTSSSSEDEVVMSRLRNKRFVDRYRSSKHAHAKPKCVILASRKLTDIPNVADSLTQTNTARDDLYEIGEDPQELVAAFVATSTLLGGADKRVDWGLLMDLFPNVGLHGLRSFWINANEEQGPYIAKLTRTFHKRFIDAYAADELPAIDFDNILDYDWKMLIEWTMGLETEDGTNLLQSGKFQQNSDLMDKPGNTEDWREKFFQVQAAVYTRFELATASAPNAIAVDTLGKGKGRRVASNDAIVARSWVKSLCSFGETKYSPQQIRDKLVTLSPEPDRNQALLKRAISELSADHTITRSKKAPLRGRPYRLNESYKNILVKLAQRPRFSAAARFKAKLDSEFRQNGVFTVPYNLDDGSSMVLTNMAASGRIRLVAKDLPYIPFGFEPGSYESRKRDKSQYHFTIEAAPTESFLYDEDNPVLAAVRAERPPSAGPAGEIPQWTDFWGVSDGRKWTDILGAFCFAFATRGTMCIEAICSALKPVLEEFEAQLIMDWGVRTGVLKELGGGAGIAVGEWWWLAISAARASQNDEAHGNRRII